jgi:hypothetical protein
VIDEEVTDIVKKAIQEEYGNAQYQNIKNDVHEELRQELEPMVKHYVSAEMDER